MIRPDVRAPSRRGLIVCVVRGSGSESPRYPSAVLSTSLVPQPGTSAPASASRTLPSRRSSRRPRAGRLLNSPLLKNVNQPLAFPFMHLAEINHASEWHDKTWSQSTHMHSNDGRTPFSRHSPSRTKNRRHYIICGCHLAPPSSFSTCPR